LIDVYKDGGRAQSEVNVKVKVIVDGMGVYISLEYSSKSPLADAEGNALLGL
jgi:hypothetical protein